jgi:hypothetical protein
MINKGPAVPVAAATAILGLVVGGVAGFYGRASQENSSGVAGGPSRPANMAGGGGGGMMGGGGGGGGRGGPGGGGQPSPSRDLTGLVRNLSTVEKVQNKGLTAEQDKTIAPILEKLKTAGKLTDEDCKTELDKINAVLTSDQKDALKAMTPQRGGGGRGGPGGAGGGMRAPGPPPGQGRMAASGGMGGPGGGQNQDQPFANERNKQALDDLITAIKK